MSTLSNITHQAPIEVGSEADGLKQRATRVADALQRHLSATFIDAIGPNPKPTILARHLNVRLNLASRVLKALRAEEPASLLDQLPSPRGLMMLTDASRKSGADKATVAAAAEAVAQFERLIAEFPTGRAGLAAAISGWDEDAHERASRTASQAAYRAMTTMLGFQADVMTNTMLLIPSEIDPEQCDVISIIGKAGVRRFRQSARITLFGRGESDDDREMRIETIDGKAASDDPGEYLLHPFCTQNVDGIDVVRRPKLQLLTLPVDQPELGVPLDFFAGIVMRCAHPRRASGQLRWIYETFTSRMPAKALCIDVLIHRSIGVRDTPIATSTVSQMNGAVTHPDDPTMELDQIDLPRSLEAFEPTERSLRVTDAKNHAKAVCHVAERCGQDLSEFQGFRCDIRYPVPLVTETCWIPLPSQEEDRSHA